MAIPRSKKPVKYADLLAGDARKQKKPQTWQQQREIARMWVAAMGGKITTHKRKAH